MTLGRSNLMRPLFAAAYLSKSLTWSCIDLLLGYFMYKSMGFSASATSILLFLFLIVGALSNIAVGVFIDRLGATLRMVLTLHFAGAMLTVLTAALQFCFAFNPILFVVVSILFRISFAAYDGPQTTLISLLPVTEEDAGTYVRLRTALAAVGRLVVTIATLIFTGWPASAVRVTATVLLVVCLLAIIATAASLLYAARLSGAAAPRRHSKTLGELPTGAGRLLISFVLAVAAMPLVSRLLIFAPNGAIPQWGALLLCIFTFGSVIGPLLTRFTETWLGWRRSWLGSIIVAVLAGDALSWTWLWPPLVTVTLALLHGVGLGMMGALQWISASRLVRRYAALTGRRTDGLFFGSVVFTVQCAVAIGALLLGSILDSFAAGMASASLNATLIMSISGAVVAALLLNENPLSTDTRGR